MAAVQIHHVNVAEAVDLTSRIKKGKVINYTVVRLGTLLKSTAQIPDRKRAGGKTERTFNGEHIKRVGYLKI